MNTWAFGFVTSLGLIVAIGAQNAFVLRAGVARKQVFAVAVTAAICDAVLIAVGVAGVGTALARSETLSMVTALGGAAFLIVYGGMALRDAFRRTASDWGAAPGLATASAAVASTLAITLLNPHVYIDTVVLLGGIGGRLEPAARWAFALGASTASVLWFFSLAYCAKALAPAFRRPAVARGLDLFVAAVLFTVAAGLIVDVVG